MRKYIDMINEGILDRVFGSSEPITRQGSEELLARLKTDFRWDELNRRYEGANNAESGFERLWWKAQADALVKELSLAHRVSILDILSARVWR